MADLTRGSSFTFPCGQWFDTLGGKEGGEGSSIQKTLAVKKQEGQEGGEDGGGLLSRQSKSRKPRRLPFPSFSAFPSSSSSEKKDPATSPSSSAPPAGSKGGSNHTLELISPVLEPCDLSLDYSDGPRRSDLILDLTRLSLKLSPDILQLLLQLQGDVMKPIAIPPPNKPLARCDRFDCVWSASLSSGGLADDDEGDDDSAGGLANDDDDQEVSIDQNGYKVTLTTGAGSSASSPSFQASLVIAGKKGGKKVQSNPLPLDQVSRVDDSSRPPFQLGQSDSFFLQAPDLGTVESITLILDLERGTEASSLSWLLESIELTDTVRAVSYIFSCSTKPFNLDPGSKGSMERTFRPHQVRAGGLTLHLPTPPVLSCHTLDPSSSSPPHLSCHVTTLDPLLPLPSPIRLFINQPYLDLHQALTPLQATRLALPPQLHPQPSSRGEGGRLGFPYGPLRHREVTSSWATSSLHLGSLPPYQQ